MRKPHFLFLCGAMGIIACCPAATVTLDRVQQRYPWNGLVDIDYTISGMTEGDDPCTFTVSFPIQATVDGVPRTVVPRHFLTAAPCDLPVTNGSFRVTWNSAADGGEALFRATGASVKAVLEQEVVAKADADYAIVDISAGSGAAQWPVRFVRAPDLPSSAFLHARYQTDYLVFKRVRAGTTFRMGTGTDDNVSINKNWFLAHLTDDYLLGLFPVTAAQHARLVGGAASSSRVMAVSKWASIVASTGPLTNLCAKAVAGGAAVTGFSLPTEAQWEYVARAGSEAALGGIPATEWPDYAWYERNSSSTGNHPVGEKKPNPWGFYDLFGPTLESCLDHYAAYPANSATIVYTNYANVSWSTSGNIVQRGGNWATALPSSGGRAQRSATTADDNARRYLGYRLVLLQ